MSYFKYLCISVIPQFQKATEDDSKTIFIDNLIKDIGITSFDILTHDTDSCAEKMQQLLINILEGMQAKKNILINENYNFDLSKNNHFFKQFKTHTNALFKRDSDFILPNVAMSYKSYQLDYSLTLLSEDKNLEISNYLRKKNINETENAFDIIDTFLKNKSLFPTQLIDDMTLYKDFLTTKVTIPRCHHCNVVFDRFVVIYIFCLLVEKLSELKITLFKYYLS